MGWRGRSSKVGGRSQEIDSSKVLQVNSCLEKKGKWKDANKENVELCNKYKRRVCTKEREGLSVV